MCETQRSCFFETLYNYDHKRDCKGKPRGLIMLVLLVSLLLGLLGVHFLEGETSGAVIAMTATVMSTLVSSLVDVARLLFGAAFGVPMFVLSNPLYVSRLVGLCCLVVAVHEFHGEVLNIMDLFFRRVLSPTVHFLYSASFFGRVLYEPAVVVFDIYVAVSKTAMYGSLALVTKCNIDLFVQVLKAVFEIVMLLARAFFAWLGGGGGTLLTNDFDVTDVFIGAQTLVATTVEVFDCACAEVGNLYRVPVSMVTPEPLARAMNHGVNVPISLAQEMLDILRFESFPTLKKTFYHLSGAVHETGRFVDAAILEGASSMLEHVIKEKPILLKDRPAKFIGSFLAAQAQGILQGLYLVLRAAIHFILPIKLDDPLYVFSVLSPREIFDTWYREAVNAGTLSAYWVLEYGYSRVAGLPAPPPRLACDFEPAFYGDRLFQSVFCGMRHAGRALTTALAIGATLPVEFTVMTLVAGGERDGWQLLQRYDGPLRFTEPFVNACELRLASAAPVGWDLSTDAAMCHCYDEDAEFPMPAFNKDAWSSLTGDRSVHCAQPQLQDVLRDVNNAALNYANVVTPFAGPFVRVYARTWTSVLSTAVRIVLSTDDIIAGDFFDVPLSGTGAYGAREDLALSKWELEGNSLKDDCTKDGFIRATALKDSPCREINDVVRLHYARVRRYSNAGLCRKSNSDEGCTCNAALPMEADSRCSCSIVFADEEVTHADSYGEARWRLNAFKERGWCGTQIVEPIFEGLEDEAGDAVRSIVNGLTPGKVDWCPKQEFLIVETGVSAYSEAEFEEGFLADRDKWSKADMNAEIAERVERRKRMRASGGLSSASDGSLYVEEALAYITQELGERTAVKASEACGDEETFTVSTCLVDKAHERSVTLAQYRDNMCSVYGHNDILCSANALAEKGVEFWVGVSRQLWNSAMAFVTGHPNAVPFDGGNRLCDAQRYYGAQASLLSSFLPTNLKARKAISKLLFFSLEWQVESYAIYNAFLILIDDAAKGNLFTEGGLATEPIYEFVERVMATAFNWIAELFGAFGDLMDAFFEDSGEFFYSLRDLSRLLGVGLTDLMLDTLMLFLDVIGQAMRVFSGDTEQIGPLITSILEFLTHFATLIPRIVMKLMGIILKSLGPVGEFLSMFVGTVCWLLQGLINGIAAAINGITFGAAGMDDDQDFGCIEGFFGADDGAALNATLDSSRRSMNDLPEIIHEFGWEGQSFCDGVVRGYADLKWKQLRPLEQEQMLSCLKQRYLGVQMAAQTGILSLQTVVYDWSSAARAIRSLARTSFAYFEDLTPAATRKYLTEVEYKEYLPAVRNFVALASDTLTPELGASMLTEAFSAVAEAVQKTGPQGKRLVRAFSSASNITSAAVEHWQSANMTQSAARVITSIGRGAQFATKDADDTFVPPQTPPLFAHPVLVQARRKLRVVKDAGVRVARKANSYVLGAAGVSSDLNPCDSEFSIVCLNCKIVDNVLETAVEEIIRGALFLRYVYTEITLPKFQLHVKMRMLSLRGGITLGVKDMFSDINIPRPPNIAVEFDELLETAGANAADAALLAARASGKAIEVLEVAAASAAEDAYGKFSKASEALDGLRKRAKTYALGGDLTPAEILARDRNAPQELMQRTYADRQSIDWKYFLENFPYVPANTTAEYVTNVETPEQVKEISIVRATGIFLSRTTEDYVPLYGYGLFYSLSRPLLAKCDMDGVIYSKDSTQSERMVRFDDAMWKTFLAACVLFGLQMYIGLPFLSVFAPFMVTILWYFWLYVVYGFSYNCLPSLPVMLSSDVNAYINRWHPEPLCMRFPALALSCDPQTDLSMSNETSWRSCFDDDAVSDLGYLYAPVYYLHNVLPDQYLWLRTTQPFRYWLSGYKVLDLLDEGLPLRENCARLLVLDIAGIVAASGTVLWLFFSLVVPPVVGVVKAGVQASAQIAGLAQLLILSVSKAEAAD